MRKMKGEVVGVRLPTQELAEVDECVLMGKALNRSDLIRTAIRQFIKGCKGSRKA